MRGNTNRLTLFCLALASCATLGSLAAKAEDATASEVVQLPQFCWGQYNSALSGPQFRIDGCGIGMNHYCPALLLYNRALKSPSPIVKQNYLGRALKAVEYTLDFMKDYPGCPIRAHVQTTYAIVKAKLGVPPAIKHRSP